MLSELVGWQRNWYEVACSQAGFEEVLAYVFPGIALAVLGGAVHVNGVSVAFFVQDLEIGVDSAHAFYLEYCHVGGLLLFIFGSSLKEISDIVIVGVCE